MCLSLLGWGKNLEHGCCKNSQLIGVLGRYLLVFISNLYDSYFLSSMSLRGRDNSGTHKNQIYLAHSNYMSWWIFSYASRKEAEFPICSEMQFKKVGEINLPDDFLLKDFWSIVSSIGKWKKMVRGQRVENLKSML